MDIVGSHQQHALCGTAGTTRAYVEAGSVKPIGGDESGPYPNSKNGSLVEFDARGAPNRFLRTNRITSPKESGIYHRSHGSSIIAAILASLLIF
jgi:hypothetical protein